MKYLLFSFFLTLPLIANDSLRTWTSKDGRTIEGQFIESSNESVSILRKNRKKVTIPFAMLSDNDVTFIREKIAQDELDQKRKAGLKEGPYAGHITGAWEKMKAADGLQYHFFAGKKLKSDQLYPLCIYLHGASNTGSGLTKREPGANGFASDEIYQDHPSFIIAPEAPTGTGAFQKITPRIFETIDHLTANLPIDRNRIYITGYSMGARGTWALIAERPNFFAAASPIAGPLGGVKVEALPKIPIWLQYGEEDRGEELRATAKKIKAVNPQFKSTEFPGAGHTGVHGKVAKDQKFYDWLFEQRRSDN